MPRGQKVGWKDRAKIPKVLPEKPLRVATGVWLKRSGTFASYLYVRGKDIFLGCFPTIDAAQDARVQKRQEFGLGRPIVPRSATGVTLATFADETYFPGIARLQKASTMRAARSRYRKHLVPALGAVAVRDVTYERVSALCTALAATGASGQTQRETLRLVRGMLEEARRRGLIPANPAALVKAPRKQPTPVAVPSYADALQVVDAITHPVAKMAASLLLRTGMRLNEALALQWADVDLDRGTIHVGHSLDQVTGELVAPKTAASVRDVEVPSDLVAQLRAYRADQEAGRTTRNDPWLFPSETEREEGHPPVLNDRNLVQRYWEPAVTLTKVPRFTPHGLRHLMASKLLQDGAPVAFVARQLGHASPAFTYKQYVRFLPSSPEAGKAYVEKSFGAG